MALPARGEVVVLRDPMDAKGILVKRVVGVAGDCVHWDGNRVELNGRPLPHQPHPDPPRWYSCSATCAPLPRQLTAKALGIIEEVEKLGGMTKAIEASMPKLKIADTVACRQTRVDRGEDVIVGVSNFRLPEEPEIDTREIDNKAVREAQIARSQKIRAIRDPKQVAANEKMRGGSC